MLNGMKSKTRLVLLDYMLFFCFSDFSAHGVALTHMELLVHNKNVMCNQRGSTHAHVHRKFLDQYGLQKILFTLKAGEKSQILMSFRLFFIEKLCHFQTEN